MRVRPRPVRNGNRRRRRRPREYHGAQGQKGEDRNPGADSWSREQGRARRAGRRPRPPRYSPPPPNRDLLAHSSAPVAHAEPARDEPPPRGCHEHVGQQRDHHVQSRAADDDAYCGYAGGGAAQVFTPARIPATRSARAFGARGSPRETGESSHSPIMTLMPSMSGSAGISTSSRATRPNSPRVASQGSPGSYEGSRGQGRAEGRQLKGPWGAPLALGTGSRRVMPGSCAADPPQRLPNSPSTADPPQRLPNSPSAAGRRNRTNRAGSPLVARSGWSSGGPIGSSCSGICHRGRRRGRRSIRR